MISLAIDGSGAFIDLTFYEDRKPIYELYAKSKKTHSQMLVEVIDCALRFLGVNLTDIDEVFCVAGPGRHTSIRVIISTLKGLFFNRQNLRCFRVNALDLAAVSIQNHKKFRIVGEYFSKEAYYADYLKEGALKRLFDPKKGKEDEIKGTSLPIFSTKELNYGKTKYVYHLKPYLEEVNLFDLNPIY